MRHRRLLVAIVLAVGAVLVTATALEAGSRNPNPHKAAAALVRSLRAIYRRCHTCSSFGATKIARRTSGFWLGVATASERSRERLRVYRWKGGQWQVASDVSWRGWGSTQWPSAVSLTGSADPDFAVEGCGAADTNCLSVVSDVGGRWHVVPFEYAYGRALVVNAVPAGRLVQTEIDACSCAGGPSTFLYERYSRGEFRPTTPPGKAPGCDAPALEVAADEGDVPTFQFDRFECRDGWALALGTGAGYTRRVVGLFTRRELKGPPKWRLLTLDDGLALPAAPTIYDLPLSLLSQLTPRLGPALRPMTAAAELIARLQREYHFNWQQVNGAERAENAYWLIAVVPTRHRSLAIVHRWDHGRWAVVGRIPGVRGFGGGWIVPVRASSAGAVAFTGAGSDWIGSPGRRSRTVLTNAGGRWHVAVR